MTSVVMTGRRMKSSVLTAVLRVRGPRGGPAAGGRRPAALTSTRAPGASRSWPSVTTRSPGGEAARDHHVAPVGDARRHRPRLDRLVGLHHEDVRALLPALHGLRRARRARRPGASSVRHDVDELARPERVLACSRSVALSWMVPVVGSTALSMKREPAPRDAGRGWPATVRLDRQLAAGLVALDLLELRLGHREGHVDRVDPVDHDHGVADVVGLDHVALVQEQVAGAAADRRADLRVGELHPRVLHRGLVRRGPARAPSPRRRGRPRWWRRGRARWCGSGRTARAR